MQLYSTAMQYRLWQESILRFLCSAQPVLSYSQSSCRGSRAPTTSSCIYTSCKQWIICQYKVLVNINFFGISFDGTIKPAQTKAFIIYGALEVSYPAKRVEKRTRSKAQAHYSFIIYIYAFSFQLAQPGNSPPYYQSLNFYFYSGRLYTILDLTRSSCEKFNNCPLLSRLYSGGNRTCESDYVAIIFRGLFYVGLLFILLLVT